jgi:REP element-mobilizing transposase RayT
VLFEVFHHVLLFGSRLSEPDAKRVVAARREVVSAAIRSHCAHRKWNVLAVHVRTNHVHVIVEAEPRPEKMMNEFKSYASRELNRLGFNRPERKR